MYQRRKLEPLANGTGRREKCTINSLTANIHGRRRSEGARAQRSSSDAACLLPRPLFQEVSQPAIFVCSMAAVEKLRLEKGDAALDEATCAMGLSLGEYSALCFAGALSFEDGVKVTKAR